MPRESSRHSAANADGCCYQRQRIVMLLRNACEAETPIRRKDAVGVPRVKGAVISLSRYPTASSECPPAPSSSPVLETQIQEGGLGSNRGGKRSGGFMICYWQPH